MKLLQQTQLLFLRIAAPVFLLAGGAMFFALEWSLKHFAEEKIMNEKYEIEAFIRLNDTLPAFFQCIDNRLYAVPLRAETVLPIAVSLTDTSLINPLEQEQEPFLKLTFPVKMRGAAWQAVLLQSSVEREDLAATVIGLLAALFVLLFGILLWVNRSVSRHIWRPFFETLHQMRQFRITDPTPLQLPASSVAEFQELHRALEELTEKVQHDFRIVKQFTENASHELQTPLAVIQNKVDALLQDDSLSEPQMQQLDTIAQNIRRMARLNQTLLLLVKIENDQFAVRERLDLQLLLEKKLSWLEDFFFEKQLVLQTDLRPVAIDINPVLAEILVTNLLTNAVKHNFAGGRIDVRLTAEGLIVSNTAAPPATAPEKLSERFERGNASVDGLGLGLAIVREICEKNDWKLTLCFDKMTWTTSIFFPVL